MSLLLLLSRAFVVDTDNKTTSRRAKRKVGRMPKRTMLAIVLCDLCAKTIGAKEKAIVRLCECFEDTTHDDTQEDHKHIPVVAMNQTEKICTALLAREASKTNFSIAASRWREKCEFDVLT